MPCQRNTFRRHILPSYAFLPFTNLVNTKSCQNFFACSVGLPGTGEKDTHTLESILGFPKRPQISTIVHFRFSIPTQIIVLVVYGHCFYTNKIVKKTKKNLYVLFSRSVYCFWKLKLVLCFFRWKNLFAIFRLKTVFRNWKIENTEKQF